MMARKTIRTRHSFMQPCADVELKLAVLIVFQLLSLVGLLFRY